LNNAQKNQTLQLPGTWETIGAVAGSLDEIVTYGLADDYFATYTAKVRALRVSDANQAAKNVLHPDQLVWVVVGDRSKVESGMRDLGWGQVQRLDADGNPVK
jgi:zinc protease